MRVELFFCYLTFCLLKSLRVTVKLLLHSQHLFFDKEMFLAVFDKWITLYLGLNDKNCMPSLFCCLSLLTFCGQLKTTFPIKANDHFLLNVEYEKGRGRERPIKRKRKINMDIVAKASVLSC